MFWWYFIYLFHFQFYIIILIPRLAWCISNCRYKASVIYNIPPWFLQNHNCNYHEILHTCKVTSVEHLWIVEILMTLSSFLSKESNIFEDQQNLPKPLFTKILVVMKVVMKILFVPKWSYFNTFQHISQVSSKKYFIAVLFRLLVRYYDIISQRDYVTI